MMKKAIKFIKEAINELKKVTWSGKKEVIGSTIVVVILVSIVAIFVGFVDLIISKVLAILLR